MRQGPALPLHVGRGGRLRSPVLVLQRRRSLDTSLVGARPDGHRRAVSVLLSAVNGVLQVRQVLRRLRRRSTRGRVVLGRGRHVAADQDEKKVNGEQTYFYFRQREENFFEGIFVIGKKRCYITAT